MDTVYSQVDVYCARLQLKKTRHIIKK